MDKLFEEREQLKKEINILKYNLKNLERRVKDVNKEIYNNCNHKWENYYLGYTYDERPKKCAYCHFVK